MGKEIQHSSCLSLFILLIGLCLCINAVCTISCANIIGTRIVIPTTLSVGTSDDLQDFIRNDGSESVGPFDVQYFLSSDQNLNGRVLISEWHVEGLKAGAQKYGNSTITIPSGTPEGTYYLVRWIDPTGILSDKNPTNNIQWSKTPIHVIKNESSGIEGIGTVVPSLVSVGSDVPVTIIVNLTEKNTERTGSVNLFLSIQSRPESSLIPAGTINLPKIPSLGEQEITGNMEIPSDIKTGTYYLFTSFVPADQMKGKGSPTTFWLNEDPIVITSSPGISDKTGIVQNQQDSHPDVLTLDTEQPDEAFIGDSFTVTDSVKNIGGAEANIVRVEYLLSSNTDGTNGKHLGWRTVMSLHPDQTSTEQKLLGVPSDIRAGLNYLVKKITVTSAVQEKNTQNNIWVSNRPINIRYNPASPIPDLTHIRTVWPKAQIGETVPITDTITNIGKGCAKDVSVAYYVSPYQKFDVATAMYLGVWRLDSICPLEQKTNTTYVTIPSDLPNGEYYLYSIIDPCSFISDCDEGMPELDKSNNINVGILTLGPCVFCN
ncbi:MAG TPA: CARDB domain-containing protein [Methanospirillum sp.]|uniref:CARDB domain-containing protein n=1 Tax=Methanospirillum sp. TaxID=45200 RepID=UPI002C1B9C34|nr:CARDB domain-containing protein [Methanospirillum sp.]HWQ62967.1 CARDB domain-containing protein [Methanospirillum sp.]